MIPAGPISQVDDFEPQPSDMVLYIRDGHPIIHAPENDGGVVPDDFLILLGVAASWHNPDFRAKILGLINKLAEEGNLRDLMGRSDERPH